MIKDLLEKIDLNVSMNNLRKYVDEYEGTDWKNYISFDDKTYKRNIVCRGKYVEIVLICWRRGQESKIHGHPKKGCLMKVLKGNLIEQICNEDMTFIREYKRKKGDISYMEDYKILHKVINRNEDSFTLHIYPLE